MGVVAVVGGARLWRDLVEAALSGAGHSVRATGVGGSEGAAGARQPVPDLVILDPGGPPFPGLEFLRALRRLPGGPGVPVVAVAAAGHRECIRAAAALGVRDYLLQTTCSLDELLARVRNHLASRGTVAASPAVIAAREPRPAPSAGTPPAGAAAVAAERAGATSPVAPPARPTVSSSPVPALLTRDQCIERARRALGAKTLSGVVAQVIGAATSPRTDVSDVATLISRDPVLSARVLQAANTAAYTSARPVVSTIPEAVRNIGLSSVRDLAAALGVFDAMPAGGDGGFNPFRCWQHSFATATICEALATRGAAAAGSEPGLAYVVGLCHDLGETLFHTHFAPEYGQVLEAAARTGRRRIELERAMLGMTHGELVGTILRQIGLPDTVLAPIQQLHAAAAAGRAAVPGGGMGGLLRLADLCANGMLLASSGGAELVPPTGAECREATGDADLRPPDPEQLRGHVLSLTAVLGRLDTRDSADLLRPLYPKRPVRVWVARERTLSALDPITAALQSMAAADVHDRLPGAEDVLPTHRGLIVVAPTDRARGFTADDIATSAGAAAVRGLPPLPVLWIVRRTEGVPTSTVRGGLEPPRLAPVTLESVDRFTAALDSR